MEAFSQTATGATFTKHMDILLIIVLKTDLTKPINGNNHKKDSQTKELKAKAKDPKVETET